MGSSEKSKFKDNGWFVGVTPRRNPEIVVAVLLEEGEHGYFAARAAAQVIKAYVEKQRTRQTQVAKAGGAASGSKQAEVAAVWHEGDAKTPDKMQAGRFTVSADGKTKPVTAAPGVGGTDKPIPPADLETTESHVEMAHPETEPPAESQPTPPATSPEQQAPPRSRRSLLASQRSHLRRQSFPGGSPEPLHLLPRFRLGPAGARAADLLSGRARDL